VVRDRGDKHELPDDTIAAYLTPEGYLEFEGNIAAAGLVQMYSDGTETWGELRLPEHVFAPSSLRSFHKKPITDDHPDDFVNVDNWDKLARGNLGSNIRPDESGKHVRADMLVTSPELIQKMIDGKRQLSNAYTTVTVLAPGFFQGKAYKFIQTEIEGNANAVVDQARAGPTARALLDSMPAHVSRAYQVKDQEQETMKIKNADELSKLLAKHKNADSITVTRKRNADATLTIGNESFDIPDELAAQCLEAAQAPPAEAPAAAAPPPPPAPAAAPEDAPAAPGGAPVPALPAAPTDTLESLRAQVDALTAEKHSDRAGLDARVDARVSLVTTARAVLGEKEQTDGVDALDLQKKVIEKVYGDEAFDLKNKNADYIGGLFLAASKKHAEDNAGSLLARTFDAGATGHNDEDLARIRAAVN